VIAAKIYKDNQKVDATIAERNEIMQKFRSQETSILLATNIIARGIDVRNAVLAINVGVPKRNEKEDAIDVDTYLHRVGRTGRHNDKGVALTVIEPKNREPLLNGMLKVHGLKIQPLKDPKSLLTEVLDCIKNNSIS
jgi:superfamily II DNA/RNA helicase